MLNQEKRTYNIGFWKNQIINPQYSFLTGFNFFFHSQPKFSKTILFRIIQKSHFANFGLYQDNFFTGIGFKNKKVYSLLFMEINKEFRNFGFHFSKGEKIQIGFSLVKSNWKEKSFLGIHFKIPFERILVSISDIPRKQRKSLGLYIPYKIQIPETDLKRRKKAFVKKQRKRKRRKRKIRVLGLEELLQADFPIKKALKIHKYSKNSKKYNKYVLKLNSYERYKLIQLQKKKKRTSSKK